MLLSSATWSLPPSADYLSNPFWVGYNGMPPCQRHPQIPLSTQTGTPNFDPFFSPLFMVVTFKQMTIEHSMYMQKVPFLCTERAVWFFLVLGFALEEKLCGAKCFKFYGPEGVLVYSTLMSLTPIRVVHPGTDPLDYNSVTCILSQLHS